MTGAAELCAHAAYRAGAGMVRLGVPGADPALLTAGEAVATTLAAAGWAPTALDMVTRCHSLAVGPGLGRAEETATQVRTLVAGSPVPVVVDADALVALGSGPAIGAVVGARANAAPLDRAAGDGAPRAVLTPHDGEFASLTGGPPPADRIAATRALAAHCGAVVLLKGPTTVVAEPGGTALLVTAGSPRLATAGTGDVLSGAIAAFVARGLPLFEAAGLAAHVHGRAAALGPPEGLVAGDLADLLGRWLSDVRRG
jgi:NAD(P)H-hydrate epimerase